LANGPGTCPVKPILLGHCAGRQLYVAELSASSRSGNSKDHIQNGSSDLILAILLLHAPTTTAGSIGVGFGILWPTDRLQNGSSDLIRAILLLHVPTTPTSVDWTHRSRIRNNKWPTVCIQKGQFRIEPRHPNIARYSFVPTPFHHTTLP